MNNSSAAGNGAQRVQTEQDRGPLYQFVYAESLRSLTQQATVLDNIRTRAGLVITGANVVTALLAAPAIKDRGLTTGAIIALILFGAVGVLSLLMLLPQKGWNFRFAATEILDRIEKQPDATLADIQRDLARLNDDSYDQNEQKLSRLFLWLRLASLCLFVEAGLWVLVLAKVSVGGIAL